MPDPSGSGSGPVIAGPQLDPVAAVERFVGRPGLPAGVAFVWLLVAGEGVRLGVFESVGEGVEHVRRGLANSEAGSGVQHL